MTHPDTDPEQTADGDVDAVARLIDALMALPPRARPAITVVGDDDVFAITPAAPPRSDAGASSEGGPSSKRPGS